MFHLFVHHLSSTEENHNQSFGITTNFASDIKLSQENQQKDILTKIKQNEEESYDVTIPSYSSEHSTLHFTNNEVKSIKISSSTYRITIVIFQNANKNYYIGIRSKEIIHIHAIILTIFPYLLVRSNFLSFHLIIH